MNSFTQWLRKLAFWIRRDKFDRELKEEMAFHREQAARELESDGAASDSARYAANRQFGNPRHLQDRSRDVVSFGFEAFFQDLRFAVRQLRKNLAFSVNAILILALGICASVSIFSFVDAALLKPLPYREPSRLVAVYEKGRTFPRSNVSYQDFLDWEKRNRVFSSLAAWGGDGFLMKTSQGIQPVRGIRISHSFFQTLGINLLFGRDFLPADDIPGSPRTVVLTYSAWQKWFAGAADIVGKPVTLDDEPYTVIGVLPRDFQFAPQGEAEFWTALNGDNPCERRRSCHNLYAVARLKDGVSVDLALAEMTSIQKQLEAEHPDSNRDQGAAVISLTESIVGNVRPIFLILLAGAGLLLLIACVNVTSLLLVRAESRRREIAVRGALGASFPRLVRQFFTEGFVLSACAAALGALFASWLMSLMIKLIPKNMLSRMPFLDGLALNYRVLIFIVCLTLLAALLFGAVPILRSPGADVREDLAEGGRGSISRIWRRFGANLVVVELALAVVLLAGAGLLGKSFYRLLHVDFGFHTENLASLRVSLPPALYKSDQQKITFARDLVSRVQELPGVQSAGLTSLLPLSGNGNTDWIRVIGKPFNGEHNEVNERDISAGYIATLQARLIRGRVFTDAEDLSKPRVAVINQEFARKYFGDEDPIGKKFGDMDLSHESLKEVVGIVEDIREAGLDEKSLAAEYLPLNQNPNSSSDFSLIVRASQDEAAVLPELTRTLRGINPDIGVSQVETMAQRISGSPTAYLHRSAAVLVGGFAAFALLLGVVGLYGVISYAVSRRAREIGVRMALGAPRGSVYSLILKEAGRLIFFGIAAGLVAAVGAATLARDLLFGVASWDLPTLLAVALLLATAALVASFLPARRAASLDPASILRSE